MLRSNRLQIVSIFALCVATAIAAPAIRTSDNSIASSDRMPAEVKQVFPNLVEITKKLTRLYTTGNQMKITVDVFAQAGQLEMVDLSNGEVAEIESRAFFAAARLKRLNLSGNKLTTLPRELFAPQNSIKEINLSNNRISSLDRQTFKNLQNLKKLDLTHNQLTELKGPVFADLTNLQELDLTGNPITSINEEFFASLPQGLQFSFDDEKLDFQSLQRVDKWAL